MTATIAKRSDEDAELTDTTNTPKWLADMLPVVDIDPWSNGRSHIKARWHYSLEKGLDGLKLPIIGSAFSNWPFSDPTPYAAKIIREIKIGNCTEAILLCKLDPSTDWWIQANSFDPFARLDQPLAMPPELWIFHDRVEYEEHPEIIERRKQALEAWKAAGGKTSGLKRPSGNKDGKSSSNFCSAIIHHRGRAMQVDGKWIQRPRLELATCADLYIRGTYDLPERYMPKT